MYIYTYIYISIVIEYGLEAKPSILGVQIVLLAARIDDDYDGCGAKL